jgi:DNA helicase-2/ATP-dependent DNA helicase PcrA
VIDITAESNFTLGDAAFHQKFGYGMINGIDGDKLEVKIGKAGTKKVVAAYVSVCKGIPF